MLFRRIAFVGCAVAVSIACGIGTRPARSATPRRPPPAASVDWPSYNNDLLSDRYAGIASIDTSNVTGLHVICTLQLGTQPSFETGPIVVGGVLYATTSTRTIAMNAATCAPIWTNTYVLPKGVSHLNRGAAYAGGRIYRGFADGHVVAIDAASGATVWNTSVIAAGSLEFIAAAPVAWKGEVIVGTGNGEYGQQCRVLALDAASGAQRWSAVTVPAVGAPGSQTWKGATHIGGGATWSSFTVDVATGVLYVPVGNPAPDYDIRNRRGANNYTAAVLEFDAATGARRAALQFDPQDAHDWDQAAAPAVITLASGTKAVLSAGKDGYLRAVDARTNAPLWQTPVTTILNATAPITTGGTHFCPSGGAYWNGPAYSPRTGLAYVNTTDWCKTVAREATPAPFVPGQPWLGSSDGDGVKDPTRSGWLNAVDAATGTVAWRYHAALPLVAGVTPTAGGLVFTADLSGNVLAFDAASGALLQSVATSLPTGGGVITYAVTGTQYVAVAAGLSSGNFQTGQTTAAIVVLGL